MNIFYLKNQNFYSLLISEIELRQKFFLKQKSFHEESSIFSFFTSRKKNLSMNLIHLPKERLTTILFGKFLAKTFFTEKKNFLNHKTAQKFSFSKEIQFYF